MKYSKEELKKMFDEIIIYIESNTMSDDEKVFLKNNLIGWLKSETAKCSEIQSYYGEELENENIRDNMNKKASFNNTMIVSILCLLDIGDFSKLPLKDIFAFLVWLDLFNDDSTIFFIKVVNRMLSQKQAIEQNKENNRIKKNLLSISL